MANCNAFPLSLSLSSSFIVSALATEKPHLHYSAPTTMTALTINSTLKLRSGASIPQLGFGVYQSTAAEASTVAALNAGYRESHAPTRDQEGNAVCCQTWY